MISIISGKIVDKTKDSLVIMTPGGVGYEVNMSALKHENLKTGDDIQLFTYFKVSDSGMSLYGFETSEERAFFSLLLSVSGVGPKSAMNILSLGSINEIQSAIAREDVKYLTAVQGIGKKTAERMVVELKNKIQDTHNNIQTKTGKVLAEVIDGLHSMGYSREEAKLAARSLDTEGKSTEDLLREALKTLAR